VNYSTKVCFDEAQRRGFARLHDGGNLRIHFRVFLEENDRLSHFETQGSNVDTPLDAPIECLS
jgi:hypothetical protein